MAQGELSDEALLAGMALGEHAAAVTFVRRYQRRVFGLAYSMTGDAGVAEDVAQEAMTRVWRHAPVFDPRRGSVASWVLTITRNLAIDALRLRRAVATDPNDFALATLRSTEHDPEDAAHRTDARAHGAGGPRGALRRAATGSRPRRRLRQDRVGDQRVRGHPTRHRQDAHPDRPHPVAVSSRTRRGGRAMSDDTRERGCPQYSDDLAELALGVLTGRDRARALSHVESCRRCADELEQLSRVADTVVQAAPEVEPPVGFEVRLLERMGVATVDHEAAPTLPGVAARAARGGRRRGRPGHRPRPDADVLARTDHHAQQPHRSARGLGRPRRRTAWRSARSTPSAAPSPGCR